jgi:hypothetical protein
MGEASDQIATHIDQTREVLRFNLEELETRMKAVTDWRGHFRKHPGPHGHRRAIRGCASLSAHSESGDFQPSSMRWKLQRGRTPGRWDPAICTAFPVCQASAPGSVAGVSMSARSAFFLSLLTPKRESRAATNSARIWLSPVKAHHDLRDADRQFALHIRVPGVESLAVCADELFHE